LYTAVMSVENHCKLSKVTVFCLQSYSFDLNVITCWGAGVELQTDFLCRSYLSQDLCHSQLEWKSVSVSVKATDHKLVHTNCAVSHHRILTRGSTLKIVSVIRNL